jgi:hypothetical protein
MSRTEGNLGLKPENISSGLCWSRISQEDRKEFTRLRASFHNQQKNPVKDRRLVSFFNELQTVLDFTDRSSSGIEERCILSGVAFGGAFICVNTQQLKSFVGRCKSSINGSFQQMGYVAMKTKGKAKACLLSVLPSLTTEMMALRQWTVRYASDNAQLCLVSRYRPSRLPDITESDLNEDRKGVESPVTFEAVMTIPVPEMNFMSHQVVPIPYPAVVQPEPASVIKQPPVVLRSKKLMFDLSCFDDEGEVMKIQELKPSFSSECLAGYDSDDSFIWEGSWRMTRYRSSKSLWPMDDDGLYTV